MSYSRYSPCPGERATARAIDEHCSRDPWTEAMWAIHDMQMYRIDRLTTFRKIRALGIAPRVAAELIREFEKEPA